MFSKTPRQLESQKTDAAAENRSSSDSTVDSRLTEFALCLKRKLQGCSDRGFTLDECFDFIWQETLDEQQVNRALRNRPFVSGRMTGK